MCDFAPWLPVLLERSPPNRRTRKALERYRQGENAGGRIIFYLSQYVKRLTQAKHNYLDLYGRCKVMRLGTFSQETVPAKESN